MILKRGVTGFTAGEVSLERDWAACTAAFKKYCYSYVGQLNGRILAFYEPDSVVGYAHAHVKIDGEAFYIFYNDLYDYVAFTSNCEMGGLEYIDHPLLADLFKNPFQVLTAAQLTEPLVFQASGSGNILLNENDLNDVELHFMNYFRSETVGDLVFNYWD